MSRKINEECGIFGIYFKGQACDVSKNQPAEITTVVKNALWSLQHRGQEACGITLNTQSESTNENDKHITKINHVTQKYTGLVPDTLYNRRLVRLGNGDICIGHVRYSTTGNSQIINNAQPLSVRYSKGNLSIAHNGNLTNGAVLREEFEKQGKIFSTTTDSEAILYTIVAERLAPTSIENAIKNAMSKIEGAYSLIIMSSNKLIAVRDPNGFRPLCMGYIYNEDGEKGICFASESCALDSVGAEFQRDIEPGEIFVVDTKDGDYKEFSLHYEDIPKPSFCIFEYIYIARGDSIINGASVHAVRVASGQKLWEEETDKAYFNREDTVVMGVPSSGMAGAIGYANASGLPYDIGLIKNNYIGRTFINPEQEQRSAGIDVKLNVVKTVVKGKKVILLDDSIVRGNTCKKLITKILKAGAAEVHFRSLSPAFRHPCYYGIDVDSEKNLLLNIYSENIAAADFIGAKTLSFLSIEGIKEVAVNCGSSCGFCLHCFDGVAPVEPKNIGKNQNDGYSEDEDDCEQLSLL